jgi:hypothetical protein
VLQTLRVSDDAEGGFFVSPAERVLQTLRVSDDAEGGFFVSPAPEAVA